MKKHQLIAAVALALAGAAAQAQIVVITHTGGESLTKDQVADIFLGKSQSLTPVDQPDGSAIYADFYKKAAGRDVAQVKSTWSRVIFSGKGQAPKQVGDSAAVKKAVAADPKAVGYVEKSAVDSTVKAALTLD
jgi:ABC-type phosphate transport system substrate-binding protein